MYKSNPTHTQKLFRVPKPKVGKLSDLPLLSVATPYYLPKKVLDSHSISFWKGFKRFFFGSSILVGCTSNLDSSIVRFSSVVADSARLFVADNAPLLVFKGSMHHWRSSFSSFCSFLSPPQQVRQVQQRQLELRRPQEFQLQ